MVTRGNAWYWKFIFIMVSLTFTNYSDFQIEFSFLFWFCTYVPAPKRHLLTLYLIWCLTRVPLCLYCVQQGDMYGHIVNWEDKMKREVVDYYRICSSARACVCLGRAEAAAAWGAGGGSQGGPGAAREELALRLALRQWPRAVELARAIAPHRLPLIQRHHAQHLEFT